MIVRRLLVLALFGALTLHAQEIEKKEDPEKRLKELGQKVATARTSNEVREATESLNTIMGDLVKANPEIRNLMQQRIQSFRQTAQRWSQVLALDEQGSISAALQKIQEMDRDTYNMDFTLLPADVVKAKRLALIQKLASGEGDSDDPVVKQVDLIVAAIKTPADLAGARQKIDRLARALQFSGGTTQMSLSQLSSNLSALDAMRTGDSMQNAMFGNSMFSNPWQEKLAPIREQILTTSLVARYDLPGLATAKGDTLAAKLDTLADAAVTQGEWVKVLECLKALVTVRGGNPFLQLQLAYGNAMGLVDPEVAGITAFLAGQGLEKAGQYATAADSYRLVLRSVGKRVPSKAATERLLAITKEHPEVAQTVTPAR